jgi:hypothetical protein
MDWNEPGGQEPIESGLYVERPPTETHCYETIAKPGALIRIKAPRQMGKSSLMLRILDYARRQGDRAVALNFQLIDRESISSLDRFLQWFCNSIAWELNSELHPELHLEDRLGDYWKGALGSKNKCTNYFQRYLLPTIQVPLTLCLDEVDEVFQYPTIATDFLGMLRAWHEEAKIKPIWKNLRLVIVHSKEVYIPLNINQSPFNVGVPIELPQLTPPQVTDLVGRHGLDWTEAEVAQLMGMVGGHPYLVRAALYGIARGEVDLGQVLAGAPTEGGLYGEHLRRHWLNLEGDERLREALAQVIAGDRPVAVHTSEAFRLTSMGLVQFRGNEVVPTCDLYRRYFRTKLLPDRLPDRPPDRPLLDPIAPISLPDRGRQIYLSYAWGGESEELVNRLDAAFQERAVTIVRDKRDLGYKGLIKEFMEQIGRGRCVVTVISDKYLKSPNCMFELVQIAQNGQFYDRIFPIVLPDALIYRPVDRIKYIKHWEDQIKELDEAMRGVSSANLQGFRDEIDQYTQIRHTIAELTGILMNMNTLTSEIHSQSEFEVLFRAIEQKLAE